MTNEVEVEVTTDNSEQVNTENEFLLEAISAYLDDTRPHGDHSYLGWHKEYIKQYHKSIAAQDMISAYTVLSSIYNLFYKHRTNNEVNEQLFITMDKLIELFLLIETQTNYANYQSERDNKFYNEAGKWNGRHCFRDAAILYENNKMFDKAITICDQAMELSYQADGTPVGMSGRKYKLTKKLKRKRA